MLALDDHEGSVSIGGRLITNFRFADDILVNVEEEEGAGVLVDCLDTTTTRYKMQIGPDKTKVMTNNPNGFQREIKIKDQRLEEVENFKYLGAIISIEILSRIAQTTGKCIPWTKSLGPLDLGPVQVIFSWTKWGVFLGPIPVGPGIKLPVEPCLYN